MARATAAHEPWRKLEHDILDAERAKQALRAKKDAKLPPLHILRTQYGLSTRGSVQGGWHIQFELPSTNFSKSTTSTHAGSTRRRAGTLLRGLLERCLAEPERCLSPPQAYCSFLHTKRCSARPPSRVLHLGLH